MLLATNGTVPPAIGHESDRPSRSNVAPRRRIFTGKAADLHEPVGTLGRTQQAQPNSATGLVSRRIRQARNRGVTNRGRPAAWRANPQADRPPRSWLESQLPHALAPPGTPPPRRGGASSRQRSRRRRPGTRSRRRHGSTRASWPARSRPPRRRAKCGAEDHQPTGQVPHQRNRIRRNRPSSQGEHLLASLRQGTGANTAVTDMYVALGPMPFTARRA